MDSTKSRLEGKSLQNLGRKILDRTSDSLQSTPGSSGKGKEVSHDLAPTHTPTPAHFPSPSSSEISSARNDYELRGPQSSQSNDDSVEKLQDIPDFLARSPDSDWIDIEMMGYWLRKCDDEHEGKCRKLFGLDPSRLGRPTWLIDVQKKCLTVAEPDDRYACLSYVWGGASTLKTGRDNLISLMREMSLESHWDKIPRTIRDTISLVDQLGIPYLWVDSLCIIQDDSESKHDQIQAMAGIYANAYVTIIAGNGWDANHGLRGIQGVTEPRHLSSFLKSDVKGNLQPYSSIWYSRGWTFQEMVFSPRKIMFQYQLAIWECNQTSWHESSLSRISTSLHSSLFQPSINPWKSRIQFSAWPDIRQYVSIVHDYANRKLTYAEDGLHAISSLLSLMSSSFSSGFISGLPEMFFNEALLWQPAEPMQKRQSSTGVNNLPSWSWAGWEGEIVRREWVEHWSHLYPYYYQSPVLIPRRNAVLQVIPAVTWFFGNTLQERLPVNISCHTYIDHGINSRLPLPPNWSYSSRKSCYYYKEQENTASAYPLPIASSQSPRLFSARYLFCRTRRGYFKSKKFRNGEGSRYMESRGLLDLTIMLQDNHGNWIGALNPFLDLTDLKAPTEGTEYELVVISSGALVGRIYNNHPWELSHGIGWGHFDVFDMIKKQSPPVGVRTDDSEPSIIEFYYVMWIEWEDGIAYRKGLGRVLKEAWDRETTEDIDLVLG